MDTKRPKKPLAKFTGGNLGKDGITDSTNAVVDPKGNLYVGDNAGGVTYFAKGSKKGVVAFKTGYGGYVNQMVVDKNGDVWSVHGPDAGAVYFKDKKTCLVDKHGKIVRNEFGERFSKGKLVQHLYTATSDSPPFSDNGTNGFTRKVATRNEPCCDSSTSSILSLKTTLTMTVAETNSPEMAMLIFARFAERYRLTITRWPCVLAYLTIST
jgi:hypothetical protein